jgi:hypothetical protein
MVTGLEVLPTYMPDPSPFVSLPNPSQNADWIGYSKLYRKEEVMVYF